MIRRGVGVGRHSQGLADLGRRPVGMGLQDQGRRAGDQGRGKAGPAAPVVGRLGAGRQRYRRQFRTPALTYSMAASALRMP